MNPAPSKLYYVYLLKSRNSNWIYIGYSSRLEKRIIKHTLGKSYSTRKYLPLEIIYYEAYRSEIDAKKREKNLKRYGNALGLLKKRIKNGLKEGAG